MYTGIDAGYTLKVNSSASNVSALQNIGCCTDILESAAGTACDNTLIYDELCHSLLYSSK